MFGRQFRFLYAGALALALIVSLVPGVRPASAISPYARGDFIWARSLGGLLDDSGSDIEVDLAGNVYMTGGFQGTVDFDPGPGTFNLTSNGSFDIFVSKLDSNGNLLWAKSIGGVGYDEGFSITANRFSGNVWATGTFTGTVDFDPGVDTANLTDPNGGIFVLKLTPTGDLEWATYVGTGEGHAIAIATDGSAYTTGFRTDFDPLLGGSTGNDIFVAKVDISGSVAWSAGMRGMGIDEGWDIAVDPGSFVYLTGAFQNTVDFDPGAGTTNLTSAGGYDIFLSKLDDNGNFLWAKATGGTDWDYGYGLALDSSRNIYTSGRFGATMDFDPGAGTTSLNSAGEGDAFLSKLDNNGNFLWAKRMGGPGDDQAGYVTLDADGNIYLGGVFRGTADFDPGASAANLTSAGLSDLFAVRLDNNGNYGWAKRIGGVNTEYGLSIALDGDGNLYAAGTYSGTADFDPGPGTYSFTSAGGDDFFVTKLETSNLATAVFGDVVSGYWAWDFVERLYNAGITGGCATNPLRYCPEETVTRAQMAVFLLRGIHGASYAPPGVGAGTGFGDVPPSYWSATFIKQLAAEGITTGCGNGNYCPEHPVTRAQMAVFLLRSKHGTAYTPPGVGAGTGFGDVQPDYWAATWIKQLVTEGITAGCGNGNYCPEQPVTRAQMAVFLVRTFSLP
jgi:hypothetical protein